MDWDRIVDEEVVSGLVRLSRSGSEEGSSHEATSELSAPDRLGRLRSSFRRPRVDADLGAAVAKGAGEALAKLRGEANPRLTVRELIGLEAVVIADGTRPSLRVRNGFVRLDRPDAQEWAPDLGFKEHAVRKVIAATGMICVPVASGLAGTALMVSDDCVLTNRHVAEAIASEANGWKLNWPGKTGIDFVAEDSASIRPSFEVTEVVGAGPVRIGNQPSLAKLDYAILRIRPIGQAKPPAPIVRDHGLKIGEQLVLAPERTVYAVGIPGRPEPWSGPGDPPAYHETLQVIAELFADMFGVKRLAPGRVTRLPAALPQGQGRVFAHDCSTLAGSSGSAVADLDVDGSCVAGLHFGGVSRSNNYAHGFAAIGDELKRHGI